ncbi:uncharacterized protein CBL_01080 [Carabus blaptoides fortunei]
MYVFVTVLWLVTNFGWQPWITYLTSQCLSRVRTVRLVRPCTGMLPPPGLTCRHGPGLGFSIRGGREHGTGFFVSYIEPSSEAHRQGLKVGDQIIRVNGFTVEDAVHKEVLQLISNHTHLTLKVRSVGMIPVKDKCTDPLSWQIIPDYVPILSESPPLEEKHHDVRVNIAVAQRAKLGCGICKGPEWKPGIFVQFTKDGGIARDAGLRPGDQILHCNNIDFTDISFNEAVNVMKMSRQLELIIRKGAGSELFPGESSGYNSSASSVTGDQSPSWSESKRLSIVKEESLELEDRLSHLDFQRYKPKCWEKISYDWDETPRQFKPTIINLSESGTTIKNNGECENNLLEEPRAEKNVAGSKLADICLVSHQHETKTVVVEVHRSGVDEKPEQPLQKSPSSASLASRSSTASSSLSSAITLELQRRTQRNNEVQKQINIDEELQKKKILKTVDNEKKHQHDKLMDEFRKAHRKMFNASTSPVKSLQTSLDQQNGDKKDTDLKDRQASCQRLPQWKSNNTTSTTEDVSQPTTTPHAVATLVQQSVFSGGPPPPPPMPSDTNTKLEPSTKPKAPPVPQKTAHQQQPLPPPCPSPDYDTLSIHSALSNTFPRHSPSAKRLQTPNRSLSPGALSKDCVDMDSLESFKLNHPAAPDPKPPSTYFNKPPASPASGKSTLKKTRPVSVTIGEYPSGTNRRPPSKFDFLTNGNADHVDGTPITSRLQSELVQTLSRSNLKKRTEMEHLPNGNTLIKPQTNGTVTISVNNVKTAGGSCLNTSHKLLTKSQSTDVSVMREIENVLANRVTIKISESDLKHDTPNSILKNGTANNNCSPQHKPLVHQKSITFGEM